MRIEINNAFEATAAWCDNKLIVDQVVLLPGPQIT